MELAALSDAALVDLAREGSSPAFAVLLHRHGPAVRAVVGGDADPTGAVISTFVAAMRRLDRQSPEGRSVRDWLLELAADQVRHPAAVEDDERVPDLDPDERDEIWAELDVRWPSGRPRRHVPAWLGWTALVVALVALGVLIPYAALTWTAGDDDQPQTLRAEPFEDEDFRLDDVPELVEQDDDIEFELPPLDLDNVTPEPDPTPDPEPAAAEPAPTPPPDPAPEQDEVPEDEDDDEVEDNGEPENGENGENGEGDDENDENDEGDDENGEPENGEDGDD